MYRNYTLFSLRRGKCLSPHSQFIDAFCEHCNYRRLATIGTQIQVAVANPKNQHVVEGALLLVVAPSYIAEACSTDFSGAVESKGPDTELFEIVNFDFDLPRFSEISFDFDFGLFDFSALGPFVLLALGLFVFLALGLFVFIALGLFVFLALGLFVFPVLRLFVFLALGA